MLPEFVDNLTQVLGNNGRGQKGAKARVPTNAALSPSYRATRQAFQTGHRVPEAVTWLVLIKVASSIHIVVNCTFFPDSVLK